MLKHNLRKLGTLTRAAAAVGVIVALAIVARFFYRVSRIEAGWSTVAAHWHAATLGRLTSATTVPLMEPPEQADYWLAEVDRIVSGPGDAARLAMGAASILDTPAQSYLGAHLRPPELPGLPPTISDTERGEAVFESRCRGKCLELAKRATDIDPANVDWWRMRAMLTSAKFLFGHAQEDAIRTAQWQTILDEAARYDPDNALYDYLAATRLWRASGDNRSPRDLSYTITIRDEKQFAAGVIHFNRGQRKKFVAFGEAGLPAIPEFLKHSRLTRGEQADVARASLVLLRSTSLVTELFRWQTARANDCEAQGDSAQALALNKQSVHGFSQIAVAGELPFYDRVFTFERRLALWQTVALAHTYPHLVSPAERRKLTQELRAAMLRESVLLEAGARMNPKPSPPNSGDLAAWAVYTSTPAGVCLLLIGGWLAWLAGQWVGRQTGRLKPLAVWQHAIAWLATYSVIFAVAGMAPAELIPPKVQPWIALGSVAGGLLFVGILLWRARLRFTLKAVFTTIFVCASICVPLAALHREGAHDDLPKALRILPQGAGALDAATLQNLLHIAPNSWLSATYQWLLRKGYLYSALASPPLVTLWWVVRRARVRKGEASSSSRAWWAALLRDVGRSALALATLLLLVDLVLLPRVLEEAEAKYQQRIRFFRDPSESYAISRAAIAAVERDRATMDAYRQATEEELETLLVPTDSQPEGSSQ